MAEATRFKDLLQQVQGLEQRFQHHDDANNQRFIDFEQKILTLLEHFQEKLSLQFSPMSATSLTQNQIPTSGLLGPPPAPTVPVPPAEAQRNRFVKLEFPRFASGDPTDWLFAVDRYCKYHNISEADRLLLASMHLDRPAARWFQGLFHDGFITDWASFTMAIQRRFGPTAYDDPAGALSKLTQTTTVLDYQIAFEEYSSKVRGLSPDLLQSIFISGLKPRIKRAVMAQRPTDLHDAFALARVFEEQLSDEKIARPWISRPPPPLAPTPPPPLAPPPLHRFPPAPPRPAPSVDRLPLRRLTQAEMQTRRERGLCYNCDEQFVVGHRCKGRPALLYIESYEEDDLDQTDHTVDTSPPSLEQQVEPAPAPAVSFNALFGQRTANSFRLTGTILGHPLQVLVDGGSTHNFITSRTAHYLHLTITTITPFRVQVGNGETLSCSGLCQAVPLLLQTHLFSLDLYILDLQGADLVLGVQWLATLGPIITNYGQLTMEFQHQNVTVILQGDTSLALSPISASQLTKLVAADTLQAGFLCFTTTSSHPTPPTSTDLSPTITTLLTEFQDVFAVPQTLPPPRTTDHKIPLKPNTQSIQVRPYRYLHFQKNEIERLVNNMLENGLI